jgi:undecaprenyl-diphosphatase
MAQVTEEKPLQELRQKAERIEREAAVEAKEGFPPQRVPRPVRNYRALVFQGYVVFATIAFAILFLLARTVAYFDFDLAVEHAVQAFKPGGFDLLMQFVSGLGFNPVVYLLCALVILYIFVIGLKWESVMLLFAAVGISLLGALVKVIVHRQRPSAELVNVFSPLNDYSFPSGHVLLFTAFLGFLWFMIYTLAPHSWRRTLGLFFLGSLVALVGISRVYLGQHWPSDVLGAYLLGSLWLALTIQIYRWGKPRFFVTSPVETSSKAA